MKLVRIEVLIMKKYILVLIIISFLICNTGCGLNENIRQDGNMYKIIC